MLALGSRRVQTGGARVGQQWMLFEISDQEKKNFLKQKSKQYAHIQCLNLPPQNEQAGNNKQQYHQKKKKKKISINIRFKNT